MKSELKESLGYIFFKNPVLVLGLIIGHLAAGDTNLQNAAALSITFFFVTVPVMLFASTIGKKIPAGFNLVCYALFSAAMLVPAYSLSGSISATIFDSSGIYPALLAVSTVPIIYSSKIAEKQTPIKAIFSGLCITAGFIITVVILGAAREFLGSGSLWGFKLADAIYPAAKLPFWGFILLGFMAAIVNWIKEIFKKSEKGEEEGA